MFLRVIVIIKLETERCRKGFTFSFYFLSNVLGDTENRI